MLKITAIYTEQALQGEVDQSGLYDSLKAFLNAFPGGTAVIVTKAESGKIQDKLANQHWCKDRCFIVPYAGKCPALAFCHGLAYCSEGYFTIPQLSASDFTYSVHKIADAAGHSPVITRTTSGQSNHKLSTREFLSGPLAFSSALLASYPIRRATPEGLEKWLSTIIENEPVADACQMSEAQSLKVA